MVLFFTSLSVWIYICLSIVLNFKSTNDQQATNGPVARSRDTKWLFTNIISLQYVYPGLATMSIHDWFIQGNNTTKSTTAKQEAWHNSRIIIERKPSLDTRQHRSQTIIERHIYGSQVRILFPKTASSDLESKFNLSVMLSFPFAHTQMDNRWTNIHSKGAIFPFV